MALKNVNFKNCKLIGLQFDECKPFLLEFQITDCQPDYSSFYQLKIKGTRCRRCKLTEVDFSKCDLSGANFTKCDLLGTMFNITNLRQADFRSSINFSINPEQNQITGAKFSLETLSGLLHKYDITIS